MKKILAAIALTAMMISCQQENQKGYEISGTAKGMENGKKVFIQIMDINNQPKSIDTAVVSNERFEFKGDVKEIDLAYIKFELDKSMPFFLEDGKIDIVFDKDSTFKSTVGGTYNNDLFTSYNQKSNELASEITKFKKDNLNKLETAQANKDNVTIKEIMVAYNDLTSNYQEKLNQYSEEFIKENNNAILASLLLENFIQQKHLETTKVQEYYNSLTDNVKNSKSGLRVKALLDAITSVEIGKKAPDFSAPSPDGKTISLKESLGKVTIIDFWASWCGPCRMENPNVVALYNELHEKGLNIIGVSLDRDATKWKEAIAKDGLIWNHISNLKHWQEPIAEMYNVKAIPATFILDENGVIVARDLRGDKLRAKVEELLNK